MHAFKLMRYVAFLGVVVALMLAFTGSAHAQRFAHQFGDTCYEYGFSGVRTPDGGYISVGSASSQNAGGVGCVGANQDIYIVKLNSNGTLAWSRTIDINGGDDIARDVIVSNAQSGGYVVCGWTTNSGCNFLGLTDMFVLRISTTGTLNWIRVYGSNNHSELAFRLVECTRDLIGRPRVGDIAVAGYRVDGNNSSDGVILRVSETGGLLFEKYYGGNGNDGFFGITESTVGNNVGDLIACGYSFSYSSGGTQEGFIVRVTTGGAITTAPTGAATYGGSNATRLTQVDELTVGNESGRLVFSGDTYLNNLEGTYVLKTAANPCTFVDDAWIGNSNRNSHVETWSIREVLSPAGGGLTNGNLILAGLTEVTGMTHPFMLEISPALAVIAPPTGVGYRVYGDSAGKGYTADPVLLNAGVSTAGYYLTATVVAAPGTVQGLLQMYLIKTDRLGQVNCYDSAYTPTERNPDYTANCPTITVDIFGTWCEASNTTRSQTWADTVCNDSLGVTGGGGPRGKLSSGGSEESISNVLLREGMDLYPNPVTAGSRLTVSASLRESGAMSVVVSDMAGHVVHRASAEKAKGTATMNLRTDGWASGTYVVEVTADGHARRMNVVIVR